MFPNKQIIVVYPDDYEDLAVAMQHEISKVDSFDCSAWSIEHYKQNAPTLSGRSYAVFLGTPDENRFTKMYQPQISKIVNVNGACLGWDGSKAIIFGEGNLEKKPAFDAFKSKLGYGSAAAGIASSATLGTVMSAGFLVAVPALPAAIIGGGVYSVAKFFMNKKARRVLRYEQTKMAIYNFLLTELEIWTKGRE
ncbi:hypothetical protein [Stutzerimonas kunmingensis]|uniref:hypothetical protein n=1 Tax=Stutzerimonas kunmingensis TaxID=1211807 RepID=UPI000CE36244|nr:hypothetical protein [Stutzerimonas kunmingensis]